MEKEFRIKDFFLVLKRGLWIIILTTLLTTASSGIYTSMTNIPLYQSSTQILLSIDRPGVFSALEVILRDPGVLEKVNENLGLKTTVESLNKKISFGNVKDSSVISISVSDPNPELAAKIANATTSVFIRQLGNTLGIYDVKVLSEARANKTPLPSNKIKNVFVGFAIGLVVGIGVVLFLDSVRDTVNSEMAAESLLNIPVLGGVSKISRKTLVARKKKMPRSTIRSGTLRAE